MVILFFGWTSFTPRMRSGSAKGNGRIRMALTTLKIAVLAPMPMAMQTTAMAAKPGLLRSVRTA
ncbi:MAG TPA: hypothetical protein VGM86_03885 [Thermoanaerobaculia bacterium]